MKQLPKTRKRLKTKDKKVQFDVGTDGTWITKLGELRKVKYDQRVTAGHQERSKNQRDEKDGGEEGREKK